MFYKKKKNALLTTFCLETTVVLVKQHTQKVVQSHSFKFIDIIKTVLNERPKITAFLIKLFFKQKLLTVEQKREGYK